MKTEKERGPCHSYYSHFSTMYIYCVVHIEKDFILPSKGFNLTR